MNLRAFFSKPHQNYVQTGIHHMEFTICDRAMLCSVWLQAFLATVFFSAFQHVCSLVAHTFACVSARWASERAFPVAASG